MYQCLVIFIIGLFSFAANADDLRPASLSIIATGDAQYDIAWKRPIRAGQVQALDVVFNEGTVVTQAKRKFTSNNILSEYWRIKRPNGLAGLELEISGLVGAKGNVLLRIIDDTQQTYTAVLNTESNRFVFASASPLSEWGTGLQYTVLGIEHILIGLDHLLFIACLVYLSRTRSKLLLTISGFTVAHSITLILAATETIILPIEPVEAVIALSIVFLAWEIAKNNRNSLSYRYPVLVASGFGLLHGFGFASVLADIGLPANETLLALLSFNIGVEIGQLLFVAVLYIGFICLAKMSTLITIERLRLPVGYCCGTVASLWMIERIAVF